MKQIPRSVFSHLFELGRLMRRRMGAALPYSLPQIETLHFVADNSLPTMRALAEYLKVKAPSATALVAELVALGLLRRRGEAQDRRQVTLALTPKGRKVLAETLSTRRRVVSEIFAGLPARERREFDRLLTAIINANRPDTQ